MTIVRFGTLVSEIGPQVCGVVVGIAIPIGSPNAWWLTCVFPFVILTLVGSRATYSKVSLAVMEFSSKLGPSVIASLFGAILSQTVHVAQILGAEGCMEISKYVLLASGQGFWLMSLGLILVPSILLQLGTAGFVAERS